MTAWMYAEVRAANPDLRPGQMNGRLPVTRSVGTMGVLRGEA